MTTKHTPGPWAVGYRAYDVTACGGQMKICDIRGWGYLTGLGALALPAEQATEIQYANARLIAAAPDLLTELEKAEDFMSGFEGDELQDDIDEKLVTIRAAIAKAKGGAA